MRFILLLVAAVIAVVAGVTALKWSGQNTPPAQQTATSQLSQPRSGNVSTVEILVARDQIPVGAVIKETMLDRQPWPAHLVLSGFAVVGDSDSNVIGQVARTTFLPHEPILKSRLGNPNDPSFLAATLPAGMRAITIATDTVSGVAGYVFPGDRVDILITHNVPLEAKRQRGSKASAQSAKPAFSEVLVSNARVLAVNLREAPGKEGTHAVVNPANVTVAVPDAVAQQIRLAEKLGTLSLTLRSLKDLEEYAQPDPTSLESVTQVNLWQSGSSSVRIVRGAGDDSDKDEEEGDSSTQGNERASPASGGMNSNTDGAVNQ